MPKKFSYPTLIKETYLDTFGHMNNAAYLVLLEEARWDFITKNNYGLAKIMATQIGPTIVEIKINFLKELKLRDEVVIESEMISYDGKIGILLQRILRNNQLCSSAELRMGLFDLQKRKLIPPTEDWLMAIGMG